MCSLALQAKAELEKRRRHRVGEHRGPTVPQHWRDWLPALFPDIFFHPFADHHAEFWRWVEAIEPGQRPRPFFAIWARGGAKTSSAEAAVVRLGAKKARRFCLYCRATQDKANESVSNIAAMLESSRLAQHYPDLCDRKLGKYGFAKGWRVDTLRCASGFSVVGLGLDAAVRGIKVEEARPDLIVLDDVDEAHDSPKTIRKKVDTLTASILPAGSTDVAILGVQNLVHGNSIFNQIAEGTADFLYDRIVSGPYPAVDGLEYETREQGGYRITGGRPTWAGQGLGVCERQINDWGLTAFLREAQHDLEERGGVWAHVEFRHCDFDAVPDIERGAVWVDPAVTSTDDSDAMGIQADGLGADGKLYRFFSWEQVTTPKDALERAVLKALELGFEKVGVETDQGGDTWRSVYAQVWQEIEQAAQMIVRLADDPGDEEADGWLAQHPQAAAVGPYARDIVAGVVKAPAFASAKAGAGHGSKVARNQRMMTDYERGRVVHVRGTHGVLERALRRFPSKPLDLADAAYWGWDDLLSGKRTGTAARARIRRPGSQRRQPRPEQRQTAVLSYIGRKSFPMDVGQHRWMVGPGWSKELDAGLARRVVERYPDYFELEEA